MPRQRPDRGYIVVLTVSWQGQSMGVEIEITRGLTKYNFETTRIYISLRLSGLIIVPILRDPSGRESGGGGGGGGGARAPHFTRWGVEPPPPPPRKTLDK